jgi:hypothetical protein
MALCKVIVEIAPSKSKFKWLENFCDTLQLNTTGSFTTITANTHKTQHKSIKFIFYEIISRAHGNFKQQRRALESFIIIIIILYSNYIIFVIVKIVTGRERTKHLTKFLARP